jgi:hypothetical protein
MSSQNGAAEIRSHGTEEGGGDGGGGRYLVAARDLSKGDLILSEYPLVAGPIYTRSRPVCLGCLRLVGPEAYRCQACSFPLCGQACQMGPSHMQECVVFQAHQQPISSLALRGQCHEIRVAFATYRHDIQIT